MNRLAFLSFTCQLGQEGERGSLVNAATLRQFIGLQRAIEGVGDYSNLRDLMDALSSWVNA